MTDYAELIEPLFSCSEEGCREECSYPASLLAIGPHGPICEGCYDEKCWNGTKPEWSDLPAFVPAYVAAIATLSERTKLFDAALKRLAECSEIIATLTAERDGLREKLGDAPTIRRRIGKARPIFIEDTQ